MKQWIEILHAQKKKDYMKMVKVKEIVAHSKLML